MSRTIVPLNARATRVARVQARPVSQLRTAMAAHQARKKYTQEEKQKLLANLDLEGTFPFISRVLLFIEWTDTLSFS